MTMARQSILTMENGALVVSTPYDHSLVRSIKGIHASECRYDPSRKVWLLDPKHAPTVAGWIEAFIGDKVAIPPMPNIGVSKIMQRFTVRYVGACKPRTDGTSSAYGYIGREWGLVFPEDVLREFFNDTVTIPGIQDSYFSLLGLSKNASQDDVSAGFRRMAKIWHPDICKDENAHEMFIQIKDAYDVLKDPDKRARYEAGLMFEQLAQQPAQTLTVTSYRAPLRSGMILIEGVRKLSMIEANKIHSWEDIIDSKGRTLIVSWPMGAKEPVEEWI